MYDSTAVARPWVRESFLPYVNVFREEKTKTLPDSRSDYANFHIKIDHEKKIME